MLFEPLSSNLVQKSLSNVPTPKTHARPLYSEREITTFQTNYIFKVNKSKKIKKRKIRLAHIFGEAASIVHQLSAASHQAHVDFAE
jgi:hypothetical protein